METILPIIVIAMVVACAWGMFGKHKAKKEDTAPEEPKSKKSGCCH